MAAAEAACHTGTEFSVLSIGDLGSQDCDSITTVVAIPGILSFLAKGDFTTEMPGINDLIPQYQDAYGVTTADGQPIQYLPLMEVTYWGFRIMIGFGALAAFAAAVALWLTRKGTVPRSPWLMRLAVFGILAPFGANIAGWVFTEMGRQPFVVAPNPNPSGTDGVYMFTAAAVSPGVTAGELLFSLIALGSVYLVLLVVELSLLVKYVRSGVAGAMPELAPPRDDPDDPEARRDDVLAFAY